MFENWREYRDYLLDNLVTDKEQHERFRKKFEAVERKYFGFPYMDKVYKVEITEILANDYFFTKLGNYLSNGLPAYYVQFKNGRKLPDTKEIREMIQAVQEGEMNVK